MKTKITLALCFLFFMLSVSDVFAQQSVSVFGRVTAAENQKPIAGASISIDKKGVGTSTNKNGEFALIVPANNVNDSLRVSCIGFQTKFLAITSIAAGQPFNIALKQNNLQLNEVSIAYYDPQKIIQKAIARISDNYIDHPHIIRGFYRMYTAKGNEPLELSEAVFDIYNFGYSDKRADIFKLIKARDKKNQRDFHSFELGQKPNTIFNYDVVNHLAACGFLNAEGLTKHKFEVTGIVDVKGYPAYEVVFKEKDGVVDESFRGKFYIDTKSYAFIYFDYGLSPAAMADAGISTFAGGILKTTDYVSLGISSDRYKVGYQKVGNKWVLSDVVGSDGLKISDTSATLKFVADVKFNYQVTAVDTNQTAPFSNKIGRQENINDHDSNDGEEFWKDYNILLSDYKTEDVFKHIQTVNDQTRLKDKFEEKLAKLAPDTLKRLDALFGFYNSNAQFNGTALIKSKGKILLSKSYGYADKEAHTAANSHTIYRFGNGANEFTAVVINQLVNEGKLSLQMPIKTYMPFYPNGDVTVAQLLTQQSGIPDFKDNADYKVQIGTKAFSLKDMVVNFCSDTLDFKSGSKVAYSNSNFAVLALIAEEVSGKPFGTLLQERIFTPLQMTDTYFGKYKTGGEQAKGYMNNTPQQYDAANPVGADEVFTSAEDLLKFADAIQANKLLNKEQIAEMLTPRIAYKDLNASLSYGWMIDKDAFGASAKHIVAYQFSAEPGFSSAFVTEVGTDSCVILLSNNSVLAQYDLTDLVLKIVN